MLPPPHTSLAAACHPATLPPPLFCGLVAPSVSVASLPFSLCGPCLAYLSRPLSAPKLGLSGSSGHPWAPWGRGWEHPHPIPPDPTPCPQLRFCFGRRSELAASSSSAVFVFGKRVGVPLLICNRTQVDMGSGPDPTRT